MIERDFNGLKRVRNLVQEMRQRVHSAEAHHLLRDIQADLQQALDAEVTQRTREVAPAGLSYEDGVREGHLDRLLGRRSVIAATCRWKPYRLGYEMGNSTPLDIRL